MKCVFTKASMSSLDFKEEVEINTMEELKELWERVSDWEDFIVSFDEDGASIMLYDDYLE